MLRALILSLCVSLLLAGQPAQAQATPINPRVGAVETHDAPAYASQMGAGWGRARFLWSSVQPQSPDQWIEAEITTAELQAERAAGRETVVVLIGVAEWARDDQGLPRGLYLPHDDPDNLWAAYVRESVSRYDGLVDRWIIWNEPDVWDETHPGFTWPGTIEDFIQLMRVSYLAANDTNPDAIIHLAAMSHWWDASFGRELYFDRLLAALVAQPDAAEHNYFYDVATLHLYFNPSSLYEVIPLYLDIQQRYGIDKPFWLVETNAAPSADPGWPVADPTFDVSLTEQAAYQPQAMAMAFAAGIERIGIYKMVDIPTDYAANPEPFGLVRADDTPRPAFTTAHVATQAFIDAQSVDLLRNDSVAIVAVRKPSHTLLIAWSKLPAAQTLPDVAPQAIRDMWGIPTASITLPGAQCGETVGDYCMIGGPPIYIEVPSSFDQSTLAADDIIQREGAAAYQPQVDDTQVAVPIVVVAVCMLTLAVFTSFFFLPKAISYVRK